MATATPTPPILPALPKTLRSRTSGLSEVLRVMRDESVPEPTQPCARLTSQGMVCGATGEFRIRVARDIEQRRQAWALAYEVYRQKGYAENQSNQLWYGLHDALPETVTFLAEKNNTPVAALTVVPDSPLGLPADELFSDELEKLRRENRRPCELVSLVSVEKRLAAGAELARSLFRLAYLSASRLEDATDFVITVNPRHVSFYTHCLLFEQLGEERTYGKVNGAPAILLRLDLKTAEQRYEARYAQAEGTRNLHRFFLNEDEQALLKWLRKERVPLDEQSLKRYFVDERPLIPKAGTAARHHILSQYLAYELELV